MKQENQGFSAGSVELAERLNSLEQRLRKIEMQLESPSHVAGPVQYGSGIDPQVPGADNDTIVVDKGLIESNIFEYGLAWFGSLVLVFGIVFLSNLIKNYAGGIPGSLVGYASIGGVFFLAWYLRNTYTHLSMMLDISAHLLIYYVTLRLYYFTDIPVIPVRGLASVLLVAVSVTQCYLAIRKRSEVLAGISLVLTMTTALFTDSAFVSLPLIILTASFSLILVLRMGWWRLSILTMILAYVAQSIWLLNNPVMGYPMGVSATHPYNLVSIFIYGTLYSLVPVIKKEERFPDSFYSTAIIINGICFSVLLFCVVAASYQNNYVWIFFLIFLLCLFYSIFLKYRIRRVFDSAFFAIYSFMALSVAVYGYSGLPDALWLLALQSLLVVSWALWFRSKIIVVMNTLLFTGILILYLALYPSTDKVNIAFVATAFISARILNWKKERLTLKTEMLRNTYLIILFFTMLFTLYHLVPKQYVTLSWTGAAVFYFIMSLALKLIKYRWMAIATVLVTGFYLFFVDLSYLETGYRVIAFFFLAIISLGASLYFTKQMKKRSRSGTAETVKAG